MLQENNFKSVYQNKKIWQWRSSYRYYNVRLQRNLFGEWSIIQSWGGLKNRLGNYSIKTFCTLADAKAHIEEINKKRSARHYMLFE